MKICLALPEAIQESASRHATFLVRKDVFAYYLNDHHGDGIVSVCCKVLPGDNEALMAAHPAKFYMPAYIGPRGWVALRLDVSGLDWNEVAELVVGSYQLIAPKRLALLANSDQAKAAAASAGPRPRSGPARKKRSRQEISAPAAARRSTLTALYILLAYECPSTRCGWYGSASAFNSAASSFTSSAATASSRCFILLAPMIGAVTPGCCSIHASATCALGTPRCRAISRDAVHHREVGRLVVQLLRVVVGLGARGLAEILRAPIARQEAARQRTPGNHADAFLAAQRHHLALFFAIDQVVVILHADEARQAVRVGGGEHLGELPGEHAGGADVERLARAHDVVQRAQRLFDRRVVIEAVDLVEIDVIGAEPAQAVVDGVQDVLARQAALVRVVAHRVEDLGGDDDAVARGEVLQRAPSDFFAHADGVHVGGVEEVDAGFQRAAEEGPALLFSSTQSRHFFEP